ncbi:MAG: hypothetical protein BroJett025_06450 [Patescibacteria group bacterium]|nr:MAG: hypothetical protein BroJett025_06450 [Patescibacteria group bacterium]
MASIEKRTTLSELWNAADLLHRPEPPQLLTSLLLSFRKKGLIDEATQLFLFDSLPLYYLLKSDTECLSFFGDTPMIPLLVQAGLASHFFNTPENLPEKQQKRIDQIESYFTVGPNDIDLKIPGLNSSNWEATVEWLTNNSQSIQKTEAKEEYLCTGIAIWDQAQQVEFTDRKVYERNNLLEQSPEKTNAVRATVVKNIDGNHETLIVIILELGFCEQNAVTLKTFKPVATIHISNIPQHDTRLQKNPNSTLAQITPKLSVPETTEADCTIEYPENFETLLFEELQLLLDPQKPLESFVAAISFFRKINVKFSLANKHIERRRQKLDITDAEYDLVVINPFISFYSLFNTFLNDLSEPIKLTQEYDIARFSSDLALIAVAVGPKEFSKVLISTGLVNYIERNIAGFLKQGIETNPFCKGLLFEKTHIAIKKNENKIKASLFPFPEPNNFGKQETHPLPWDGLTALIQLLKEKTEIELSQYPLLCFINLFCAPFFEDTQDQQNVY